MDSHLDCFLALGNGRDLYLERMSDGEVQPGTCEVWWRGRLLDEEPRPGRPAGRPICINVR